MAVTIPYEIMLSKIRLTYGITPPKASHSEQRRREIAGIQARRITKLPVDALVVYDLQNESSRTETERPFPFRSTIDPLDYAYDYLSAVPAHKIVYRSVSGQDPEGLGSWLTRLSDQGGSTVLVGAPSRQHSSSLRLNDAYAFRRETQPTLPTGGVVIAERHSVGATEDSRVLKKVDQGCSFFISQAVYSLTASKDLLSDLYFRCQKDGRAVPPVLVTLSPCGSQKTLDFMHWLGIAVPRWLCNELRHANDILQKSVDISLTAYEELLAFANEKNIPLGCNIRAIASFLQ
ncbi:MAG: hypothetical protein V3V08_12755 [Nannocystaceae bacterium]